MPQTINDTLSRLEQALNAPTLTSDDWMRMQADTQALVTALQALPAAEARTFTDRLRAVISRLEAVEMDLTDQLKNLRG